MPGDESLGERLLWLAKAADRAADTETPKPGPDGAELLFRESKTIRQSKDQRSFAETGLTGRPLSGSPIDERTGLAGDRAETVQAAHDRFERNQRGAEFDQRPAAGRMRAGQSDRRRHHLHSNAGRELFLSGGLAGQGDAADRGLEFESRDDGRAGRVGIGKGDPEKAGDGRRDHPYGSGEPVCLDGFSNAAQTRGVAAVDERSGQLLRQRAGGELLFAVQNGIDRRRGV